jgi:hypothetical protein
MVDNIAIGKNRINQNYERENILHTAYEIKQIQIISACFYALLVRLML